MNLIKKTYPRAAVALYRTSPQFRKNIEERIKRIEQDAAYDESQISRLDDIDHIRRQMKLVDAEKAEASRMKIFLDRSVVVQRTSLCSTL